MAVSLNGQPNDQLFDIALMKGDGFGNFGRNRHQHDASRYRTPPPTT